MASTQKVPSVYSYSPAPKDEQQWGDSLSDEAVTMINTKLELDVQDNKSDELRLLLQVLDGMHNFSFEYVRACRGYPDYTSKDPEQIITDYMSRIFQRFEQHVDKFGTKLTSRLLVDIVVTVPVVSIRYSYRTLSIEQAKVLLGLVLSSEELNPSRHQSCRVQRKKVPQSRIYFGQRA
jgi:hypothetical protein